MNKLIKNLEICHDNDDVELAVSTTASPKVFPPSLLVLIIGISLPPDFSHHDTETLSPDASISARIDCIPFELLRLIGSPKDFPLSFDVLMNTSDGEVILLSDSAPLAITKTLFPPAAIFS